MSSEVREVRLPAQLCIDAERRFGARFGSVEELLVTSCKSCCATRRRRWTSPNRRVIEQRLKDLGYI